MKPTEAQFVEYVEIRDSGITNMWDSGITNMWDIMFIVSLSKTGLTKDICLYIMEHFLELAEEYEVDI